MVSEWRESWKVVVAAFFVGMIVDGVLNSFGLFLVAFLDGLGENRGSTAFIGSVANSFTFLLGPISGSLVDRFGSRLLVVIGCFVSFAGFFASSYLNTLPVMCLTYGVLGGTGFGLMLLPANACVIKHFNKSRATACGIANCGSGIGIFVFNILINYLIGEFGWRKSLLLTSGILLNGLPCGLLLVSSRREYLTQEEIHLEPESNVTNETQSVANTFISVLHGLKRMVTDIMRLVKNITCIMVLVSTFFVALAVPVPFGLLPDAVLQGGMGKSSATWLVSSIGISSIIGRLSIGWIGDKLAPHRKAILQVMLFSLGISLVILPLLPTFQTKLTMTCLFGLSSGGFIVLFPVILADEFGPGMIGKSYGLTMFTVGIASLFATPLAGWIYDVSGNYNLSFYVPGVSCCVVAVCVIILRLGHSFKRKYITTVAA